MPRVATRIVYSLTNAIQKRIDTMHSVNRILDRWVRFSHEIFFFNKKYHPYLLASDLGILMGLLMAYVFTSEFEGVNFWVFLLIVVLIRLVYKLALKAKNVWLGTSSRSLLQDSIFIILPIYGLLNFLFGHSVPAALDLAALFFALYFGIVRLGCFMGGCCYGLPSRLGVNYPKTIFVPVSGCRKYAPGEFPSSRVFPVQLIESVAHLTLFVLLYTRTMWLGKPDGLTLPWYFLVYGSLRFFLDFIRRASVRPRYGRFSEAQVVSVILVVVCSLIIFFTSWMRA